MEQPAIKFSSKDIVDCLYAHDLGDGTLFAAIQEGRFVFDALAARWLFFSGHHWELDHRDRVLADVEKVAQVYASEIKRIYSQEQPADEDAKKAQEKLLKWLRGRVAYLRSRAGRSACVDFARTLPDKDKALVITGDMLDADPFLLATPNGVIDLQTGLFRAGRPEDYLFNATRTEWCGIDAPRELWQKTGLEIFDGDEETWEYFQRLMGYAITGLTTEPILPVLFGKGRNGKTVLMETIQWGMGSLARPIQSEMLLDQGRGRSSSGPSPDILDLKGVRIAIGSETDEGRKFSTARVKMLTGSDKLIARGLFAQDQTVFEPSHTLFLQTNHKPKAHGDDYAFWQRMVLIPFRLSFVGHEPKHEFERRRDKDLKQKLKAEAPGILAWLVEGALKYFRDGLGTCPAVEDATKDYQRDSDVLIDWIEDRCLLSPEYSEEAGVLYKSYKDWYADNYEDDDPLSQKLFGAIMGKRYRKNRGGEKSRYQYYGLKVKTAW